MRLTSAFWVSAFIRRCMAENAYAVVRRKGATEAGAIWVVHDDLQGALTLYSPAPALFQDREQPSDEDSRKFTVFMRSESSLDITERLHKEQKFDSDLWVIDVECRVLPDALPLAKEPQKN